MGALCWALTRITVLSIETAHPSQRLFISLRLHNSVVMQLRCRPLQSAGKVPQQAMQPLACPGRDALLCGCNACACPAAVPEGEAAAGAARPRCTHWPPSPGVIAGHGALVLVLVPLLVPPSNSSACWLFLLHGLGGSMSCYVTQKVLGTRPSHLVAMWSHSYRVPGPHDATKAQMRRREPQVQGSQWEEGHSLQGCSMQRPLCVLVTLYAHQTMERACPCVCLPQGVCFSTVCACHPLYTHRDVCLPLRVPAARGVSFCRDCTQVMVDCESSGGIDYRRLAQAITDCTSVVRDRVPKHKCPRGGLAVLPCMCRHIAWASAQSMCRHIAWASVQNMCRHIAWASAQNMCLRTRCSKGGGGGA